ncbi:hypothetical protein HJFPF1_08775 [Paramyrothecium foliicola]|nr:hypothetical protein HJFPF1_08775 [Paramyrothecium foliicola]
MDLNSKLVFSTQPQYWWLVVNPSHAAASSPLAIPTTPGDGDVGSSLVSYHKPPMHHVNPPPYDSQAQPQTRPRWHEYHSFCSFWGPSSWYAHFLIQTPLPHRPPGIPLTKPWETGAPTFCKCTCFKNSTIIPLGSAHQSERSGLSSPLLLDRFLHGADHDAPQLRSASSSCSECTKSFCLSQGIDFCKEAKEDDVTTMCFQRDSNKDKIIVWGFIFGTVGLLGWAAFKRAKQWRQESTLRRQDHADLGLIIGTVAIDLTTGAHGGGEVLEHGDGVLPVDAGVGDADAALERRGALGGDLLVALVDVGLDHDTNDDLLTLAQLVGDDLGNLGLVVVVLLGVAVGAVDHDGQLLALVLQGLLGGLDTLLVKVGALAAAAQDNEAVLVALGAGDGGETLLGDTHEVVAGGRGADGVNGHAKTAVGAVLEANREGQAGGQLTMQLGLGGTGANGTDGNAVGKELRGDGVEHLAGDGHAIGGEIDEELARDAETLVDLEGGIDIRVVDETLPANSGARLLEVGTHDDDQVVRELGGQLLELRGVLVGSLRVVYGAGANDDQKLVAAAHDDLSSIGTALDDGLDGLLGHGDLGGEQGRGDEGILPQDCIVC